jgi:hypothetical protein
MHKCRGEVGRGSVGGRRETTCSFAAPRPFRVRLPPFGRRPRLQDDRCGAGRLIQRLVLKSALTTAGPGALAPERRPVTTRHILSRVGRKKRFGIRLRAVHPSARCSGSCCPGSCTRPALCPGRPAALQPVARGSRNRRSQPGSCELRMLRSGVDVGRMEVRTVLPPSLLTSSPPTPNSASGFGVTRIGRPAFSYGLHS